MQVVVSMASDETARECCGCVERGALDCVDRLEDETADKDARDDVEAEA